MIKRSVQSHQKVVSCFSLDSRRDESSNTLQIPEGLQRQLDIRVRLNDLDLMSYSCISLFYVMRLPAFMIIFSNGILRVWNRISDATAVFYLGGL